MIVESKLFILLYISNGEYTYANLTKHIPLPGDTIWLTGMVNESG